MSSFRTFRKKYKIIKDKFASSEKIELNKKALSNIKSSSFLYSDNPGSGLGSLTKRRLDHFRIVFDNKEPIDTIRFDQYWIDKKSKIDYVKIDVEGHELDVLNGFGDLIYKTKLIQFEFGGCNIDTRTYFQDFWYFFNEKAFMIYRISPRGLIPIKDYTESDEYFFGSTNFIALNQNI